MATAIYMRVSTEKQEKEGVSLATQKERLAAYCVARDLKNTKEYLDVGSGRSTNKRTNFNRMMDDMKNGFIDNIVIFKLDRLTRSVIDLNKLVEEMNGYNCHLHSCTENLDTTTPSGRMMINLIGTFAQWESETISERVSVNMQTNAEEGIWQSSVPYGFFLGDDKRLKIHEEQKAIFLEACDKVFKGSSFSKAEKETKEKYNLDWPHGFLIKKLKAPSTVGDVYRNKVTTRNTHPPLIEREKADKLLLIADERHSPRTQIFSGDLFRQKIVCPHCNNMMSLRANKSEKDGSNLYSYNCYYCYRKHGKAPSISEKLLEEAFERYLDRFDLEPKKEAIKTDKKSIEIRKLKEDLALLEKKKKRIQTAWINGFIEDKDLLEHQDEIDQAVIMSEKRLKELDDRPIITDQEVMALKTTLKDNYKFMEDEERIEFIQRFVRSIHVDRKLLKGYKRKYKLDVTDIVFY